LCFASRSVIWIQGKTNYQPESPFYKVIHAETGLILQILIRDIDDPFEVGKKSYADIDLTILFEIVKKLSYRQKNNQNGRPQGDHCINRSHV
jgi:hypothetical protein